MNVPPDTAAGKVAVEAEDGSPQAISSPKPLDPHWKEITDDPGLEEVAKLIANCEPSMSVMTWDKLRKWASWVTSGTDYCDGENVIYRSAKFWGWCDEVNNLDTLSQVICISYRSISKNNKNIRCDFRIGPMGLLCPPWEISLGRRRPRLKRALVRAIRRYHNLLTSTDILGTEPTRPDFHVRLPEQMEKSPISMLYRFISHRQIEHPNLDIALKTKVISGRHGCYLHVP